MEIDKLLKKEEFKSMDENLILSFKKLSEDVKGKSINEILELIIKFSESMPKNKVISEEEKTAMINAITASLNDAERTRFKQILQMLG